jgi:hypothetical protein
MNTFQIITSIIAFVGVSSIVTGLVYIGRKLEILDSLKSQNDKIILPELKDLRERLIVIEAKISVR